MRVLKVLDRIFGSPDLRILALMVAGAAIFGIVDGSGWRGLSTPTLAYRPAILFGLTLVFGWRGFVWSQLVFLAAFTFFLGWRGAALQWPLYLASHAAALWVFRRFGGTEPWFLRQTSTVAFLVAAGLATIFPALLGGSALRSIGITPRAQVSVLVDTWLRVFAASVTLTPALLVWCRSFDWFGLPGAAGTANRRLSRTSLLELGAEIAVWTITLVMAVNVKAAYGLNVTYLMFLPPLAFTLLRGLPLAVLALAANGIVATTLWIQLGWGHILSIDDFRVLIAIYSITILVLATVVEERKRSSSQVEALRTSQAALRESERHFRTLANSAAVMVWITGLDKLCTFVNDRWLEFTGRSMEQEMGDGWASSVHPQDYAGCMSTYVSSFDARKTFEMEYRIRRADGEYRWILDKGTPLYREGEFAGYIGSCIDVTEHRMFTERLRASEAWLMDAQRLARVGNWERDLAADRIQWSNEMLNILGVKSEPPLRFEDLLKFVHPSDCAKVIECEHRARSSTLPFEIGCRIIQPDGTLRYVRSVVEGVRNDRGELTRIVGATQDITEQVMVEEEMRRARALLAAAREDESRRIARDLHDDITQRLGLLSADLADAATGPMPSGDQWLSSLHSYREDVVDICEGVRRISHQLHPSIVDTLGLPAALESLCNDYSSHAGAVIRFDSELSSADLALDISSCLYRITQEALSNVSKHARSRDAVVSLKMVDQTIQLRITDSGVGFDPALITPGLGLQSMRERVALVNGTFSLESDPGIGTRIFTSVPLRTASNAASA